MTSAIKMSIRESLIFDLVFPEAGSGNAGRFPHARVPSFCTLFIELADKIDSFGGE
jgi:hypothetical protein